MPISSATAIELTAKHYAPFPGPGSTTFDAAVAVSGYLKSQGVTDTGVIGVAISKTGYYYIGVSPGIQRQLGNPAGHVAELKRRLGVKKVWLCSSYVDQGITNLVTKNFGCAEKKIMTQLRQYGDKVTEISVVAHPDHTYSDSIPAHVVVGNSDGAYIAPCDSCLLAAKSFLPK